MANKINENAPQRMVGPWFTAGETDSAKMKEAYRTCRLPSSFSRSSRGHGESLPGAAGHSASTTFTKRSPEPSMFRVAFLINQYHPSIKYGTSNYSTIHLYVKLTYAYSFDALIRKHDGSSTTTPLRVSCAHIHGRRDTSFSSKGGAHSGVPSWNCVHPF